LAAGLALGWIAIAVRGGEEGRKIGIDLCEGRKKVGKTLAFRDMSFLSWRVACFSFERSSVTKLFDPLVFLMGAGCPHSINDDSSPETVRDQRRTPGRLAKSP